jgi:hypothetical protein
MVSSMLGGRIAIPIQNLIMSSAMMVIRLMAMDVIALVKLRVVAMALWKRVKIVNLKRPALPVRTKELIAPQVPQCVRMEHVILWQANVQMMDPWKETYVVGMQIANPHHVIPRRRVIRIARPIVVRLSVETVKLMEAKGRVVKTGIQPMVMDVMPHAREKFVEMELFRLRMLME